MIWPRKPLINFKLQIIGISSNFAHSRWSQHHNIWLSRWTFPCNKNRAILRSFLVGQLFFGRVLTTAYSRQSESIQMNQVCCVRNKIICALPCHLGIPYLEYSMPHILRVRSVGKPSAKNLKQNFLKTIWHTNPGIIFMSECQLSFSTYVPRKQNIGYLDDHTIHIFNLCVRSMYSHTRMQSRSRTMSLSRW